MAATSRDRHRERREVAGAGELVGRLARSAEARRHPAARARRSRRRSSRSSCSSLGKSPVDILHAPLARRLRHAVLVAEHAGQRAAPLILTALCVAIPARLGLVMIGGEGALVLGGFARRGGRHPVRRLGVAAG